VRAIRADTPAPACRDGRRTCDLGRNAALLQCGKDQIGIDRLEHEARQSGRVRPQIGALGFVARQIAEQLEIVFTEDRKIVARAQRVMTALGQLKAEPGILRGGLIQLAHHVDDDVIENRPD
jgi:hypothetical protein